MSVKLNPLEKHVYTLAKEMLCNSTPFENELNYTENDTWDNIEIFWNCLQKNIEQEGINGEHDENSAEFYETYCTLLNDWSIDYHRLHYKLFRDIPECF